MWPSPQAACPLYQQGVELFPELVTESEGECWSPAVTGAGFLLMWPYAAVCLSHTYTPVSCLHEDSSLLAPAFSTPIHVGFLFLKFCFCAIGRTGTLAACMKGHVQNPPVDLR